MDENGWIRCFEIYKFRRIQNLKVPYDTFIKVFYYFNQALQHSLYIRLSEDLEYVRTVYCPDFWPNCLEVDYTFKQMIGDKKKNECFSYNEVEFKNNLIIHGCHQRIWLEFNKRLTNMIKTKVEDPSRFWIYYSPLFNSFDVHIPYNGIIPNISRKRP